jgi:hypothetical protein
MTISEEEKQVILELIEEGCSTEDIMQLIPGLTEGSVAAFRAHLTRGTYEENTHAAQSPRRDHRSRRPV